MENSYDVIIVGAGPAGMTAAIYAIRANMKVLMLDRLSPGGAIINTNEIENYTGAGKLTGAELAIKMFEHTQELGVEFDYRTVIDLIDEGEWKIVVCEEDDAVYQAKAVILATGTVPRRIARASSSSLKAHKSSVEPPPRHKTSTSVSISFLI